MNLYRRSILQASVVIVLACLFGFTAATGQRRKPHKLRATALLEFTRDASGASTPRLVPITILDEGSFHDASIYKSTPEPMALDDGVVYEAQKTGQIIGYFTVGKSTKGAIWTAMGRWRVAAPKPKASASPTGSAASADERPILHRAGSSPTTPSAGSASPSPGPSPASPPSDDRPVLHRPAETPSPAAAPSPAATPAAPEPEPEDSDRPTLRHRTPPSEQPESGSPPPSEPARPAPASTAAPHSPAATPSAPAVGQALVAVSDAQPGDSRSYEFIWKPGEREAIEPKMRRLALAQLPHDNASTPLTEKSLSNAVIRTFDLDLSNDAVIVLTAEIAPVRTPPPAKPGSKTGLKTAAKPRNYPPAAAAPPPAPVTRYVTLIARVDFEGDPQKLAASVTDSSRLDVTPRLELIDAVDVDGDGLGELLFREYSFDDKSFVIYSIGRSTVTKVFEGASQPLK